MASRSLGSLTIDLIAKIGGWTQGLTKAERDLDRSTKRMNKMANDFGRSIGASLRSAATGFLAFAGVGISIGAATTAIKGAIDRADQLRDASIRLGVGVETLSAFGYAAQQTGTDIEELNKGLLRLSRNATTALDPKSRQAGLFEALGVSKDALTDLNKLVPQVANAFAGMEDGATKAALAQELFGRSGANLIEFLNQGESGLKTLTDRARELGIVIDDETAAAADDFNDKLADLKAAGTGLATQVASELLPQLTKLVDWATEFVSDGDNARDIADGVADAMRGLADAIRLVVGLGSGLSTIREQLAGAENAWRGFIGNFGLNGTFSKALKDAMPWAYKEFGGSGQAAPTPSVTRLPTVTVTGTRQQSDLEKRLAGFFATGGRTDKPKKSGKSDAEKEAEQLKAAYDRMNASLAEQVALFGETTEAAKVRYELENGELAKLTDTQKAGLIAQAETLDALKEEKQLQEDGKRLIESLLEPFEQVNAERAEAAKLLEAGAIAQEDYNRAIEASLTPAEQLLEDLQFEISLLGKTRDEQELLTEARLLGAEAATEQGQAALQALKDYQAAEKQNAEAVDIADGARDSFRGLLGDLREGKGLWDSLTDAALNFLDVLFEIAAKNATEQLFGAYGSTGSGTTGGGWLSAFADFFSSANSGFGFSEGGFTGWGGKNQVAGIVHKGEYVMPMDAVSRIGVNGMDRIARGGALGPVSIPQNFIVQGRIDSRTAKQLAQEAATQGRRAMARSAG
jgi:hypothetical protein